MFGRRQDTNVAGDFAEPRPSSAERKCKRRKRARTKGRIIIHNTESIPVWEATDGENFGPYSAGGFRENRLPSTQKWRNLRLFNNGTQDDPLLISEEIFRENVNDLLNGIDECAENPAQWSRDRTNSFFDKIQRFLDSWKRQLMMENEKMDLEVLLVKRKFDNKHDTVTNRLNILTGVLQESINFMEFSEFQKRTMQSIVEDLNHVRSSVGVGGQLVLSESALAKELKAANWELIEARKQANEYSEELIEARKQANEYSEKLIEARQQANEYSEELIEARHQANEYSEELIEARQQANEYSEELIEARQQANEYSEELRKLQDSLKEANLKLNELMHTNNLSTRVDQLVALDKCLQHKEKELKELKKQVDKGAKKQMNTESELIRTREQFQNFAVKSLEITQTKQKELSKMLYEIQTSLRKKNPEYKPSDESENESLNQDKLFRDIQALIKYDLQWVTSDNDCRKKIMGMALETDCGSTSLRVSEYELHLITLISSFLKVTPFPVNSSCISSYVANIDNGVDLQFVENLLQKFPSLFKEVVVAPGSMDKNWTYLDLKPVITI